MVKRKYLVIFFCYLYHSNVFSSAWLVDEGKILTIESIEISNHLSDNIQELTRKHYDIKNKIQELYDIKSYIDSSSYYIDPNNLRSYALHKANSYDDKKSNFAVEEQNIVKKNNIASKRLDKQIQALKDFQMAFNPYYSRVKFSEYIEFRASSRMSIFSKLLINILENSFTQNNLLMKSNRLFFSTIELGGKFKLYQSDKWMLSLHNSMILSRMSNISTEFKISAAYQRPIKLGTNISNIEIGITLPIKYLDDYMSNKAQIAINYTSINKFNKYQFMLIGQQFYSFYPNEHKYKKLLIRNKLSIVKNLSQAQDSYDTAIEIGYFQDISPSNLTIFDSGLSLSIWKKF